MRFITLNKKGIRLEPVKIASKNQEFSSDIYAALCNTTIQEFLSQNKWEFSFSQGFLKVK